jgi:hypothetical protein
MLYTMEQEWEWEVKMNIRQTSRKDVETICAECGEQTEDEFEGVALAEDKVQETCTLSPLLIVRTLCG